MGQDGRSWVPGTDAEGADLARAAGQVRPPGRPRKLHGPRGMFQHLGYAYDVLRLRAEGHSVEDAIRATTKLYHVPAAEDAESPEQAPSESTVRKWTYGEGVPKMMESAVVPLSLRGWVPLAGPPGAKGLWGRRPRRPRKPPGPPSERQRPTLIGPGKPPLPYWRPPDPDVLASIREALAAGERIALVALAPEPLTAFLHRFPLLETYLPADRPVEGLEYGPRRRGPSWIGVLVRPAGGDRWGVGRITHRDVLVPPDEEVVAEIGRSLDGRAEDGG